MIIDRPESQTIPSETTDALLAHIARYRLTTFPVLLRLPELAPARPRRIKEILRQCQRCELVQSATLCHAARYWYLTEHGAQACGLGEGRFGPLSESAKLRAVAMLRYCCLADPPRRRLLGEEIARWFSPLYRVGSPAGYYFDPAGEGRLGLLRIDAGRRGRWDRIVDSVREDVAGHVRQTDFRQIIAAGRFEITVLTVLPQKSRRIAEALSEDAGHFPLRVTAMPELLPLVTA